MKPDQVNITDEATRKIADAIDSHELITFTRELVKINTVWDPDAGTCEKPAVLHIADWAERQGFQVELNTVAPGRLNAIVTWPEEIRKSEFGNRNSEIPIPHSEFPKRVLMFEGHTDVVTPGNINTWNYEPFGAKIVDDRIYGRGTNDTKGNLAAMLVAMAALKKSGINLNGSIIGGVLCDEEGDMTGVQDFIRRGHADTVTGAVICEPQDGMLCFTQKGALRVKLTIQGKMSHGAMPLAGLNTAPAIAHLIDGFHQLECDAIEKFGKDKHLGWPSFTPTVILAPFEGEAQLNVMPGEARLLVDIRTVPGQSHDDIRKDIVLLTKTVTEKIREHYRSHDARLNLKRDTRLNIKTDFITDRPCTFTDINDPIVKAADWATRRITGQVPVYAGVPGATDGTYLWASKNIPIITMGAGDREVPHQADEWVNIDQLIETAHIYALTALHYLSGEPA
ncbi:M20/M25/M40 family metallo-hydrolase [Desulfococcaceae bacterium HSG9]|nr:M20/M25/M40 family metallo-hydrolase [Desulfococcaceae bacterium HSG9]